MTGASGFVGRAFVREATRRGWDVLPLVRGPQGLAGEGCVDLSSPAAALAIERMGDVDAVAHFASHVDFSPSAPSGDFFDVGPCATAMLASFARRRRARLVFASGVIVLGRLTRFDSQSLPNPATAYAHSKLLCEEIVTAAGCSATILRIGGVFGRRGPEHLGLNRAIDCALDRREPPTVVGKGEGLRNYIFVDDLAQVVATCIDQSIDGTHLVGGSEPISIAAMLQKVCEVLLPGGQPNSVAGSESADSIVVPSAILPRGRDFAGALRQILSAESR